MFVVGDLGVKMEVKSHLANSPKPWWQKMCNVVWVIFIFYQMTAWAKTLVSSDYGNFISMQVRWHCIWRVQSFSWQHQWLWTMLFLSLWFTFSFVSSVASVLQMIMWLPFLMIFGALYEVFFELRNSCLWFINTL